MVYSGDLHFVYGSKIHSICELKQILQYNTTFNQRIIRMVKCRSPSICIQYSSEFQQLQHIGTCTNNNSQLVLIIDSHKFNKITNKCNSELCVNICSITKSTTMKTIVITIADMYFEEFNKFRTINI